MDLKQYLRDLRADGYLRQVPNVSENTAQFLSDLVRIAWVHDMLEFGTANGYSTIHFASVIAPRGGKIVSIDYSEPAQAEALRHLQATGFDHTVDLKLGNVMKHIDSFARESFDFVFIDAEKKKTLDFFRLAYPLVRPGGFIVIDDVVKFAWKMPDFRPFLDASGIDYSLARTDDDDGVILVVRTLENDRKMGV